MTTSIKRSRNPDPSTKKKKEDNQRIQMSLNEHKKAHDQAQDKKKKPTPSAVETITKAIISSAVGGAVVSGISEAITTSHVTENVKFPEKLGNVDGNMIKGPASGGELLDRPLAGGLADISQTTSVNAEYVEGGKVSEVKGSGSLNLNDTKIDVEEYLPGSSITKIAAGKALNAGDGLATLIDRGAEEAKAAAGYENQTNQGQAGTYTQIMQQGLQAGAAVIGSMALDMPGRDRAAAFEKREKIEDIKKERDLQRNQAEIESAKIPEKTDEQKPILDADKEKEEKQAKEAERLAREAYFRKLSEERDNDLSLTPSK